MAFVVRNTFWRPNQVPDFPVEIDWSHSFARGLEFLCLPGVDFKDVAERRNFSSRTNPSRANGPYGPTAVFNGSTQFLGTGLIFKNGLFASGVSLTSVAMTTSVAAFQRLATLNETGGNFRIWLQYNNDGTMQFGSVQGQFVSGSAQSANVWSVFSGTTDYTTRKIYKNGTDITTGANGTMADPAVDLDLQIGRLGLGSGSYSYGASQQAAVMVHSRYFSPVESGWFGKEPFAMLKPKISRKFYNMPDVIAAGGGGSFKPGWASNATRLIGGGLFQ